MDGEYVAFANQNIGTYESVDGHTVIIYESIDGHTAHIYESIDGHTLQSSPHDEVHNRARGEPADPGDADDNKDRSLV